MDQAGGLMECDKGLGSDPSKWWVFFVRKSLQPGNSAGALFGMVKT